MSPEAKALAALHAPDKARTGDMWHCARLGIVSLALGHKQGRRAPGHTRVFMYHWGNPSLTARPHDLRDFDPNAGRAFDPINDGREQWDYVGNLFEMMPYTALTGHVYEWKFDI